MEPKTKLEIISPYTPEHEGPFCTRDGIPVELKFRDGRGAYPVGGYMGEEDEAITTWSNCGAYNTSFLVLHRKDLMNAREVPVAREFWVNEYAFYDATLHEDEESAAESARVKSYIRTIHVREVLPGDGE